MGIDGDRRASPTVPSSTLRQPSRWSVSARINTEMRAGVKTPMRGSARDLEVFS